MKFTLGYHTSTTILCYAVLVLSFGQGDSALADSILSLEGCSEGPGVPASLSMEKEGSVVESYSCFGIDYVVAQPSGCTVESPCGFIIDTHGYSLDAQTQALNDNSIGFGIDENFVVALPTAPTLLDDPMFNASFTNWRPTIDHTNLIEFVEAMASLGEIDSAKVHAMGFSQGGFATWMMLCRASETICSVAPLAASGLDDWTDNGEGYGNTCFSTGAGPAPKRSILYTTGTYDPLAPIDLANQQLALVLEDYNLEDVVPTTSGGEDYEIKTYVDMDAGLTFTYVVFDSVGDLYDGIGGHCYPTSPDDFESCTASINFAYDLSDDGSGAFNHRCCSSWGSWGAMAVDFFVANPCTEKSSPPSSSKPAGDGSADSQDSSNEGFPLEDSADGAFGNFPVLVEDSQEDP